MPNEWTSEWMIDWLIKCFIELDHAMLLNTVGKGRKNELSLTGSNKDKYLTTPLRVDSHSQVQHSWLHSQHNKIMSVSLFLNLGRHALFQSFDNGSTDSHLVFQRPVDDGDTEAAVCAVCFRPKPLILATWTPRLSLRCVRALPVAISTELSFSFNTARTSKTENISCSFPVYLSPTELSTR